MRDGPLGRPGAAGTRPSAYRVVTPDIRASFMVYEIVLAIRRAGERAGVSTGELVAIFHDNGARLLERVEA